MIELAIRVVLSLGVVLGLLWLIARMSSARTGGRRSGLVKVHARQPLGRNAYLSVVTIGDQVLLVGVTEHQVNLISELPTQMLDTLESVPTELHALPSPPRDGDSDGDSDGITAIPARPAGARRAGVHHRASRRGPRTAARAATTPAPQDGSLTGSILSTQTWKQTFAAVSARSAGRS